MERLTQTTAVGALMVGLMLVGSSAYCALGSTTPEGLFWAAALGVFPIWFLALVGMGAAFRNDFPLNRADSLLRVVSAGPRWAVPVSAGLSVLSFSVALWSSGGASQVSIPEWSAATAGEQGFTFGLLAPFWFLAFLFLQATAHRLRVGARN